MRAFTTRVQRAAGDLAEAAGKRVTSLPGFGAVACGVAGGYELWGRGWSLLIAAGFLLAIDRRMP